MSRWQDAYRVGQRVEHLLGGIWCPGVISRKTETGQIIVRHDVGGSFSVPLKVSLRLPELPEVPAVQPAPPAAPPEPAPPADRLLDPQVAALTWQHAADRAHTCLERLERACAEARRELERQRPDMLDTRNMAPYLADLAHAAGIARALRDLGVGGRPGGHDARQGPRAPRLGLVDTG